MKRLYTLFSGITCALTLCATLCLPQSIKATEGPSMNPGTYEATVDSVGGKNSVSVTVSESAIEAVEITDIHDTKGIRDKVVERYPAAIVENQSINLDNISGATLSSTFVKAAIRQALSQATDNLDSFQEKVSFTATAQENAETDVVVVGAGLAGLTTAFSAAERGYSVILLEELSYIGGNALVSGQILCDAGEEWDEILAYFQEAGAELTFTDFFGGALQRIIPTYEAEETDVMNQICQQLLSLAQEKGLILMTETPATGLIIEDGEVKGVTAKPLGQEEFEIRAKATILASGGFQGNAEMVDKYLPFASGAMRIGPSKGAASAFTWLEGMDIATRDMEWPLAMFYSISPMGNHAVCLTMNYINENGDLITEDHDYNSGSMETFKAIGNKTFYGIWSQGDAESVPGLLSMKGHIEAGAVKEYPSMSAILEDYDLPNLIDTLTGLGYAEDETFYVAIGRPGIYGTMGGIEVDENYRVMKTDGEFIPGLFATGEVIGRNYGGALGGACKSGYEAGIGLANVLSAE